MVRRSSKAFSNVRDMAISLASRVANNCTSGSSLSASSNPLVTGICVELIDRKSSAVGFFLLSTLSNAVNTAIFSSSMIGANPVPGFVIGVPQSVQVTFVISPNTWVPQSATSFGDFQTVHNIPSQSGIADLLVAR